MRYQLIIEETPSAIPGIIRLRKTLKDLLRCHGMRCVRVEEIPAEAPPVGEVSLDGAERGWPKETMVPDFRNH